MGYKRNDAGELIREYCEIIDAPLWYHSRGLSQTASGYGSKLNTGKKALYNGRYYRLYCSIFSNSGTCYIIARGEKIIVEEA